MEFEWDENKKRTNRQKHGIGFEAAVEVFYDPFELTEFDDVVEGENRWKTIGMVHMSVLLVVHADRKRSGGLVIRIISARTATKSERRRYEQNRGKDR